MASFVSADSQKEANYIDAQVREHYLEIPPGLCWVLAPLLGAMAAIATFGRLDTPILVLVSFAAAVLGLPIARSLVVRVPAWNSARRERQAAIAGAEFRRQFEVYLAEVERLAADIEEFRTAIRTKSYRLYVQLATAVDERRSATNTNHERFFDSAPTAIVELWSCVDELIKEVESDPVGVRAYEPDLEEKIEFIKQRVAANNVPDFDLAWQEVESIFERLAQRDVPFKFARDVKRLKREAQEQRDLILSDLLRARFLKELQDKDEVRRHHGAMEELAKEQNDELRRNNKVLEELAEVRNDELHQHNDALERAAEDLAEAARRQADADEERNRLLREHGDEEE